MLIDKTPNPNQVVTSFRALCHPQAMMKWAAGTKPFGSFDKIEGLLVDKIEGLLVDKIVGLLVDKIEGL